ncbi:MAG: hypothetical protein H6727_12505 [Myxococcales bacterium]|nr:hypothetical protein [Myxococcales bacterium]
MKLRYLALAISMISLLFSAPKAFAGDGACNQMYTKAGESIKKDPQCKNDAYNVIAKIAQQRQICRNHRDNLKKCNMAKRHESSTCRGQKRTCKTECRDDKKACIHKCARGKKMPFACKKACPNGTRGKSCRKACESCVKGCNRFKRTCKKVCREVSRPCQQAARRKAHDCRTETRTRQEFKVCQDARALSRKAWGALAKCGLKHYGQALMCSVGSVFKKTN